MWELDHKESWAPRNRHFQTVALEKTLERPLDCKEIKSVNQNIQEINLNIHWKDWCWSWSSNILAACYEDLTHWKRLLLGKIEGGRRRGWQRMGSLDSIITNSISVSFSKLRETVRKREAYHAAVHGSQRVRHDCMTRQRQRRSRVTIKAESIWKI